MAKHSELIKFIGRKIQSLRRQQGLSQEKFAKRIGRTGAYLSKVERGECVPSLETLLTIADHLQVSPADLLAKVKRVDDKPRNSIKSRIEQLLSVTPISKAKLILKVAQQIHQSE